MLFFFRIFLLKIPITISPLPLISHGIFSCLKYDEELCSSKPVSLLISNFFPSESIFDMFENATAELCVVFYKFIY